jgi:two-component sensor histidine kinase
MSSKLRTLDAAMRLRALSAGLQDKGISILHQSLDLVYDLVENLHPAWPGQQLLGSTDAAILPPDLAQQLAGAKSQALLTGATTVLEIEILDGATRRMFEARISPDRDTAGLVFGLFTILTDVTDVRQRELALTNLMREVSHRSKNLLAIVQSVAMQTAHHSDGIDSFLQKFRGRLHALASTQDLVTESNWRGTLFHALVTAQFSRLGQTSLESLRISGDNPMLGPNAALHVGLAIHELATNAVLHGALSEDPHGRIDVSAHIRLDAGTPVALDLEWNESGLKTPPVRGPRFGTLVLERIVPLSVGGAASYDVGKQRVTYRLTVPADQFES